MLRDMTKVKPVRPKLSFLSAIAKLNLDPTVVCNKDMVIFHITREL